VRAAHVAGLIRNTGALKILFFTSLCFMFQLLAVLPQAFEVQNSSELQSLICSKHFASLL
jgi:hypothetical protein